jgi:dTDP-4-dehydrorhamnose 3,5-epimerase
VKFLPTDLAGAILIHIDPMEDERGYFARLWCRDEFKTHGIAMDVVQSSISHTAAAGTLRGLHFQWPPSKEGKIVRCERGKIHDVIVDLRPQSSTFTQHIAVELDGRSRNALYVPPGFAHGFQTLEADCDVLYMMSDEYQPALADGVRFDDPAFGVHWPLPITCISARDSAYPDFEPSAYCGRYLQDMKRGEPE